MFDSQYFQFLVYFALISFNILMIISVIATAMIIVYLRKLSNRGVATLDRIHETASNFGESAMSFRDGAANFGNLASQFTFFKKRKSLINKIISAFFE
jgi:hypothetical protein